MPFCPECGKSVAPTAKFCRNCGASQSEVPEVSDTPATFAAPAAAVCLNCKSPLQPDEKFCGNCGSKAPASPAPVAVPLPPPPAPGPLCLSCRTPLTPGTRFCGTCGQAVGPNQAPPASPPQAPFPGSVSDWARTCRVCGNTIKPGDKYCSKCLSLVKDAPPALVPPAPPLSSLSSDVCASCGTPVAGTEKFCGTCGSLVVAARREPVSPLSTPATPAPARAFCGNCGAPVTGTTRFCGGCGAPVSAPVTAAPVVPPVPSFGREQVIGVIANARRMKMFGASWDTFNIVVTDRRMILVQLTQAMLNTAIAEAQAKAKAEGKGFFGIVGDQISAQFQYAKRYETLSPDAALAETPGNTTIENASITSLDLRLLSDDDSTYSEFSLTIKSAAGKNEFRIGEDDRFVNTLKTVYGDRVHLPTGYFRPGGMKIKFF